MTKIIGRSIGETETGSLEFISKDLSAVGEYVCIEYNNQTILGMISSLNRGSIMLESDIRNPDLVEKINELEGDLEHYVRGEVMILGDIENLQIPRIPAPPGITIRKAEIDELKKVFQKDQAIKIGTVLTQPEVDVKVDVNKMVSRHLAILAMTGAGKSNTTTVIIDQLLAKNGTMLVFDMHSEYGNIEFKNGNKKRIAPKINPKNLSIGEYKKLLKVGENAVNQEKYLRDAHNYAKAKVEDAKELKDEPINFIEEMKFFLSDKANQLEEVNKSHYESVNQVLFKLEGLQNRYGYLFSSNDESSITKTIQPGCVNIIGLGSVDEKGVDIIVKHALTEILTERKKGKLKFATSCVTGKMTADRKTPECVAYILYKQPSATLSGQGYSSDVKYWMPFIGNVGFHSAPWRGSFGGSEYISNGSHGCVNLPTYAAATLYKLVSQGDPVVTYY